MSSFWWAIIISILFCLLVFGFAAIMSYSLGEQYRVTPLKYGQYRIDVLNPSTGKYSIPNTRSWHWFYCMTMEEAEGKIAILKAEDKKKREEERERKRQEKQFRRNNPIRYF